MNFGERLRTVRGDRPQKAFAEQLGFHFNTIGRWERGDKFPTQPDIEKILQHNPIINPSWFIIGEGSMYRLASDASANTPNQIDSNGENQHTCTEPKCVAQLSTSGHMFDKEPSFDTEILSHIFNILHEYKDGDMRRDDSLGSLSKEKELDVISLSSGFLQEENYEAAKLICAIVDAWFLKKTEEKLNYNWTLTDFGEVTKVDLLSDEEKGVVEIDLDNSDIFILIYKALKQLPNNPEKVLKALSTLSHHIRWNKDILVRVIPYLNKKYLKGHLKYSVTGDEY